MYSMGAGTGRGKRHRKTKGGGLGAKASKFLDDFLG